MKVGIVCYGSISHRGSHHLPCEKAEEQMRDDTRNTKADCQKCPTVFLFDTIGNPLPGVDPRPNDPERRRKYSVQQ
jgi:hypothetical protein